MHEAAAQVESDEREVRARHRTLDGGRVTPAPLLEPGRLIAGRYELGARIGEGGNGAVYRGRHVGLDLPLAIKVIPPLVTLMDGVATPSSPLRAELLTRFVREARERLAQAEARATLMLSEAIGKGSVQAVNYFVALKYVEAITKLAAAPNQRVLLMPLDTSGLVGALAGIAELTQEAMSKTGARS